MRLPFVLIALALLTSAVHAQKPEQAAQQSAEAWLGLLDAGSYSESFDAAAPIFQQFVPKEGWIEKVGAIRKPLGAVTSRKLKSAQATRALPGAPDGEYMVLQFDAAFASRPAVVETLTAAKTPEGAWKVSGYFVK